MLLSIVSYMYVFVPHVCLVPVEVIQIGTGVTGSLSHCDAGNHTQVLCKYSTCSQTLNHFFGSNLFCCFGFGFGILRQDLFMLSWLA